MLRFETADQFRPDLDNHNSLPPRGLSCRVNGSDACIALADISTVEVVPCNTDAALYWMSHLAMHVPFMC